METSASGENRRPGTFQPGQSGNPGGRPKGSVSLVQIMLKKLAEQCPDEPEKVRAEKVVEAAVAKAEAGDFQMFKEILERVDGKVTDKVEVTRKDISQTVESIRTKIKNTPTAASKN